MGSYVMGIRISQIMSATNAGLDFLEEKGLGELPFVSEWRIISTHNEL